MDPRNHVIDGDGHWRHLANMVDRRNDAVLQNLGVGQGTRC